MVVWYKWVATSSPLLLVLFPLLSLPVGFLSCSLYSLAYRREVLVLTALLVCSHAPVKLYSYLLPPSASILSPTALPRHLRAVVGIEEFATMSVTLCLEHKLQHAPAAILNRSGRLFHASKMRTMIARIRLHMT